MRVFRGDSADLKNLIRHHFFECLTVNNFLNGHGFFTFDTWEVVKVFPDVVVFAFPQINAVVRCPEYQIVEISCSDFHFFFFHGSFFDGVVGKGKAVSLYRTLPTVGIFGKTLQRSEFHQGLVVSSRMVSVEECVGEFGKEFHAFFIINRCLYVIKS